MPAPGELERDQQTLYEFYQPQVVSLTRVGQHGWKISSANSVSRISMAIARAQSATSLRIACAQFARILCNSPSVIQKGYLQHLRRYLEASLAIACMHLRGIIGNRLGAIQLRRWPPLGCKSEVVLVISGVRFRNSKAFLKIA